MFPQADPNGHLQQDKQEHPEGQGAASIQEIQEIVRQETDNGRAIVRFLVGAMEGRLEGSKPSHRLQAARQLVNLGFTDAQGFIDENTQPSNRRKPPTPRRKTPVAISGKLAQIVREETEDGRVAIRFLVDVMLGTLQGFKPHHRLAAARELLRRGFDNAHDDGPGRPPAVRQPVAERQQPVASIDDNGPAPMPVRRPAAYREEAIDHNTYPLDHRHADEFDDEAAAPSYDNPGSTDHDDLPRTAPGYPRTPGYPHTKVAAPDPKTFTNREPPTGRRKSDTRNPLRIFF